MAESFVLFRLDGPCYLLRPPVNPSTRKLAGAVSRLESPGALWQCGVGASSIGASLGVGIRKPQGWAELEVWGVGLGGARDGGVGASDGDGGMS
jgi:hypothetical protein